MAGDRSELGLRVRGVDRLARALKDMDGNLGDLRDLNVKVAAVVWRAAVLSAPRDTGALAASVKPSATRYRARIRSRKVYAGPVHWGWPARNIRPQPWASEAAASTEPTWFAIYRGGMQELCDQVAAACPPYPPLKG